MSDIDYSDNELFSDHEILDDSDPAHEEKDDAAFYSRGKNPPPVKENADARTDSQIAQEKRLNTITGKPLGDHRVRSEFPYGRCRRDR